MHAPHKTEPDALKVLAELEMVPVEERLAKLQSLIGQLPKDTREVVGSYVLAAITIGKEGGFSMNESNNIERRIAIGFGLVGVIALIALAILFPEPSQFQYLVFRVTLSLVAACLAIIIPGLFDLKVKGFLRAGGPLAAFVLVYLWNPAPLVF